jgi:hypothetical protein
MSLFRQSSTHYPVLDKVRADSIRLKHELIQAELNTLLDKVRAGNI